MLVTYKYRLKFNQKFMPNVDRTLDVCRDLYNAGNQERKARYDYFNLSTNYYYQQNQLPELKKLLKEYYPIKVHSQVLQNVLKRLSNSYDNFFNNLFLWKQGKLTNKPGLPRFKSKERYNTLTYTQFGFSIARNKLKLSNIGTCRIVLHRPIEGKIKTCSITRRNGKYYAAFVCEVPDVPKVHPKSEIAIDLNLKNLYSDSNGQMLDSQRIFKQYEDKIARLSKQLSRKKKGSKTRKKVKKILGEASAKIVNVRSNIYHYISKQIVTKSDVIYVDDVQVDSLISKNSTENSGKKRININKSYYDSALGIFKNTLINKAEKAGKYAILVSPEYTTQDCSRCGNRQKISITQREYRCERCGLVMERDHNSALNILNRGREIFKKQNPKVWNVLCPQGLEKLQLAQFSCSSSHKEVSYQNLISLEELLKGN